MLVLKSYGQFKQDTSKKVQYLLIPVFFKTPENGFSYGVSGSLSFNTSHKKDSAIRSHTRTSVIQAIGFLTTKRQNIQVIDASIYFPKEKYILLGQLSHSYFPDRFWGLGPNTKDNDYEHYLYEQIFVTPHIKRKIGKHFFVGLLYEFQTVYNIHYTPGGLFANADFYGKKNYIVSGLGPSLAYDSRDISFWPSKGFYMQTQLVDFGKQFLSDYTLAKWVTDLRYFKKVWKSHIVAMQLYNYQTFGNTPLRELASFGGPLNMRGFYQGRFRADNMISFITEYRAHLIGRFSGVLFGGLGNIYNHYSELRANNIKYSDGGGLRFALLEQEKLHIRVDYGYSDKFNRGLYVTVGECF
jgi:outer membrane protein assembly factor BamA